MLNVSADVKTALKRDFCHKELRITIGSTVLTNSAIYKDGFKLTEAVMDGTVEFVGCISSILEFKVSTLSLAKGDYKGQSVTAEVAVKLGSILSDYIPLFHGYVDSCETSADGYWQKITCFDALAYLTDTPVYNWYKSAFGGGSVTMGYFRSYITGALGLTEEQIVLPNDSVKFKKRYRNKDITGLILLRHITQINGAFGIIGRSGSFAYRYINDSADPERIPYYRSMEYENTVIRPINTGLTIRTNSNDAGVTVTWANYQNYAGTDPGWNDDSQDTYLVDEDDEDITDGNYVVESNLIAYKLKKGKKQVLAANMMASIGNDAVFRPYKVVCNGLPYLECCDKVLFTKGDNTSIEFVITKRTLQGVQNMTDTYECSPEQEIVNGSAGGGSGVSTADASYVSNVWGSTRGMSGNPDNALGLIEKSITANGTYAAGDDGAEGYSQVTVDVPGGGGGDIGGIPIQGYPTESIAAWSTVHIEVEGARKVWLNLILPTHTARNQSGIGCHMDANGPCFYYATSGGTGQVDVYYARYEPDPENLSPVETGLYGTFTDPIFYWDIFSRRIPNNDRWGNGRILSRVGDDLAENPGLHFVSIGGCSDRYVIVSLYEENPAFPDDPLKKLCFHVTLDRRTLEEVGRYSASTTSFGENPRIALGPSTQIRVNANNYELYSGGTYQQSYQTDNNGGSAIVSGGGFSQCSRDDLTWHGFRGGASGMVSTTFLSQTAFYRCGATTYGAVYPLGGNGVYSPNFDPEDTADLASGNGPWFTVDKYLYGAGNLIYLYEDGGTVKIMPSSLISDGRYLGYVKTDCTQGVQNTAYILFS